MIKVKHFLDAIEPDDGERLWIEPIGLTLDLQEWCKVTHVASHLGPPRMLADWLNEHEDGYEFFRGCYHQQLQQSGYRESLQSLACFARQNTLTLLHHGDQPDKNSGTALREFLNELEAWCPKDEK